MICDKMNLPIIGWAFRIHRVYLVSTVLFNIICVESSDQSLILKQLVFRSHQVLALGEQSIWGESHARCWHRYKVTICKFPGPRRHNVGRDPGSLSWCCQHWCRPQVTQAHIVFPQSQVRLGAYKRIMVTQTHDSKTLGPVSCKEKRHLGI